MQHTLFRWIGAALILFAAPLIVLAAPDRSTTSSSFSLSSTTTSQKFSVAVPEAGCIVAQIKSWSAATSGTTAATSLTLSAVISSSRSAKVSGSATSLVPLWTSLAFTSSDIASVKSGTVTVSMLSSRSSSARGTVWIEFPPSQTPCEFKALAATTRGRVNLSWRYTGRSFKGSFVVQRSSDGRTWSAVSACARSASSSSYTCTDTGLTSARTYYYRACALTSGTTCGSTAVTPPLSVKAP
jgi:hypothetical protein